MTKSSPRLTVMNQAMISKGENPDMAIKNQCRVCKEKILFGDKVVIKKTSAYTCWYHKKCAEKVNII